LVERKETRLIRGCRFLARNEVRKEKAVGATGLGWVANKMARNLIKTAKCESSFLARSAFAESGLVREGCDMSWLMGR
jgi:hypothetical protein